MNLIVAKNATGKTRVLYFITFLARLFSGRGLLGESLDCKALFESNKVNLEYILKTRDFKITEEVLRKEEKELINRSKKGNYIYSETEEKAIAFNPPEDKLTIEVRRNEEEYPYLEELIRWGENVNTFAFSGVIPYKNSPLPEYGVIFHGPDKTGDILEKKINDNKFKEIVLNDFNSTGYEIEDFYFHTEVFGTVQRKRLSIIKEKGLDLPLAENLISEGMFRVFSTLVIFNYYILLNKPCVLIFDDLGEGLDFDRSSKLTKLLFDKVKTSKIQLIVSSNDRFLMNAVDLKYWNVLDRKGQVVTSYNYENKKEVFEGFSFTGLNNFDFFALECYKGEDNE